MKNYNNENNTNSNNNSINKDLNENNNNGENDSNSTRVRIDQNSNNNTLNNSKNILYNYNYQTGRISSTIDIKENERERKKILLDDKRTQINLRRKTKLEDFEKQKEEDVKYLKEMIELYPFGWVGGGAPNRNKKEMFKLSEEI